MTREANTSIDRPKFVYIANVVIYPANESELHQFNSLKKKTPHIYQEYNQLEQRPAMFVI